MATISACLMKRPRKAWGCALCKKAPDREPHLVLFGAACEGDKPYRMRLCLNCAAGTADPVVRAALPKPQPAAPQGRKPE